MEAAYFSSYEDEEIHRLMLNDRPRTEAYRNAIFENDHLFKNRIAMDIGAGTGMLSLFMAKAGAKKVYSIEASIIGSKISEIAKINHYENIIVPVNMKVEDFSLPAGIKVDIIVSEWMGFYLLHESMLSSVIHARDKFLAPDGVIFPSEARLYACPCDLGSFYNDYFYFWDNLYGFNLGPIKEIAYKSKQIKPEIMSVDPSKLLSEPVCIKKFNLKYISANEVEQFSCTNFVGISKPGTYQGLCLWFECDFDGTDYDENGDQFGTLKTLSTSPVADTTHWRQTVVVWGPLKQPYKFNETNCDDNTKVSGSKNLLLKNNHNGITYNEDNQFILEKDEVIGWKLEFHQSSENKRHYNITFEMLDAECTEHPVPCECPTPRCLIIAKMLENEETELENSGMELD